MDHVVTLADRDLFKACRRAWDLGSPARQNFEPIPTPEHVDLAAAVRAGLGAYYFPAMWSWSRPMVRPIAHDTFDKALQTQRQKVCPEAPPPVWAEAQALGHATLDSYFDWAEEQDTFTAVRANEEFRVVVADPDHPDDGVLAPDGGGIHLQGVVDVVVSDELGRLWVVIHRISDGRSARPWADPGILALDDGPGMLCWALESFYVTKIAGAIVNELRVGPPPSFRRTQLRKPPKELAAVRRQAATELAELVDPATAAYPSPGPSCRTCPFVAPCLALAAGEEPGMEGYRRHVPEVIQLPPRTGSLGPQVVHGWKTKGPGTSQPAV
ncbi:MAG TPA: hypothetical protein VFW71_12445 [Actinomycetota bacterium]|nr:hypothetical protein [Actinomycetota bacterium]